ncbi:hypothetical protein LBMAG34_5760 [Candidatus Saccharibacteria bacterium]|nr:hypothetical protein LBMAG34_5760 [Candidatus Saccharibacteria bacterium]
MKDKKISPTSVGIIVIISVVLGLVVIFGYIQNSYSTRVKSITVTSSSGPVAPEFQQTQSIYISKNICEFTTTKTQTNQTSTEECKVLPNKFEAIQNDAKSYDLVGKIIANEKDSEADLLGGKNYSIRVELNDGTILSTEFDNNFNQSIEPFLDNLNLYVPQFSRLGL